MADDNLNMETTKFKITLSQDENQKNIATFEATRQDFVSYRLILQEDEVTTKTQGVFQKLSPLVKNSKILLVDRTESPLLTVKKNFEKENLVLIFFSDLLESSFTLLLPKIETSPFELLLKRVEKLEAQIQAVPQLVFDATCDVSRKNTGGGGGGAFGSFVGFVSPFKSIHFIKEDVVGEEEGRVVVKKSGRYQIILSPLGSSQIFFLKKNCGFGGGVYVGEIEEGEKIEFRHTRTCDFHLMILKIDY